MALTHQAVRLGQRRLSRIVPWIGGALALLALGSAIRRKGVVGGTMDTALNAVPFVGAIKAMTEMVRGRAFIRDRTRA